MELKKAFGYIYLLAGYCSLLFFGLSSGFLIYRLSICQQQEYIDKKYPEKGATLVK